MSNKDSNSKEKALLKACKKSDLKTVTDVLNYYQIKIQQHQLNQHKPTKSKTKLFGKSISKPTTKSKSTTNISEDNDYSRFLNINCRETKFQMTPLMIASLRGSKEIVILLLNNGADLKLKDSKGNTAIQLACMKQRFHVIDVLLQNGANPNETNAIGWNCLTSAVNFFHEDSAIMLLLLLQTGTKTDQKDSSGMMPIDHAVKKKKINAIRVLLNYDPTLVQYCTRALINACIKGYFDIVLLLLNFGVNPNKIDQSTGTGALHEAVRYDEPKNEKNRSERLKIVYYLAMYGANPNLSNSANETPMKLALFKDDIRAEEYISAMKIYEKVPHMKPKFVDPNATSLRDITKPLNYSKLVSKKNWTHFDPKYCSAYEQLRPFNNGRTSTSNLEDIFNLIDDDPTSMWTFNGDKLNWIIFDLKAEHVITKLRIFCWKSKEMPCDCFLQVSNSLEGPWNCVQSFKCQMIGNSLRNSPGVPLDIDGFYTISRYWRLVFANNYGASTTSFHGLQFFGYDYRISRLLEQFRLIEYEDLLYENDLNQVESLASCSQEKFDKLQINSESDKEKLWSLINDLKKKVQPLKSIEWFNEPVTFCLVGKSLPSFSVISSSPYLTETLELLAHGGAILNGETLVDFEPSESSSMAIFKNVSFMNCGEFTIEIRSIANHNLNIRSQTIRVFDKYDPEYEKLATRSTTTTTTTNTNMNSYGDSSRSSKSKLKSSSDNVARIRSDYIFPLDEGGDTGVSNHAGFIGGELYDSDDEMIGQTYNLADFSNHGISKMKIRNWLTKSNTTPGIYETSMAYGHLNQMSNNKNVYLMDNHHSKASFNTTLPFHTPVSMLSNEIEIPKRDMSYDPIYERFSNRSKPLSSRSEINSYTFNHTGSPIYNNNHNMTHDQSLTSYGSKIASNEHPAANSTINSLKNFEPAKDYEVQGFSLEFNDEVSSVASTSLSNHIGRELAKKPQIMINRDFDLSPSSSRQMCEARVFVNNNNNNNSNQEAIESQIETFYYSESTPITMDKPQKVANNLFNRNERMNKYDIRKFASKKDVDHLQAQLINVMLTPSSLVDEKSKLCENTSTSMSSIISPAQQTGDESSIIIDRSKSVASSINGFLLNNSESTSFHSAGINNHYSSTNSKLKNASTKTKFAPKAPSITTATTLTKTPLTIYSKSSFDHPESSTAKSIPLAPSLPLSPAPSPPPPPPPPPAPPLPATFNLKHHLANNYKLSSTNEDAVKFKNEEDISPISSEEQERRSLMHNLHQELEAKLKQRRQSMQSQNESLLIENRKIDSVTFDATNSTSKADMMNKSDSLTLSVSAIDAIVEEAFNCLNNYSVNESLINKSRQIYDSAFARNQFNKAASNLIKHANRINSECSENLSDSDHLLSPSETFTFKARKALEAYKLSRSSGGESNSSKSMSSSMSSSSSSASSSVNSSIKSGSAMRSRKLNNIKLNSLLKENHLKQMPFEAAKKHFQLEEKKFLD